MSDFQAFSGTSMSPRTPERDLRGKETLDIDQDVDLESLRKWRFLTKLEMKS